MKHPAANQERHGNVSATFLADSTIVHLLSLSCHLGISVALSVLWIRRRFRIAQSSGREVGHGRPSMQHRLAFSTSLSLALLYLLLFVWNYFYCQQRGDGHDKFLIVQYDLAARTVSWIAVFAYLLRATHASGVLRVWWCLFLVLSCSSLVLHWIHLSERGFLQVHIWVLDLGSLLAGLILNSIGFYGGRTQEDGSLLQEPLLNGPAGSDGTSSANGSQPSLFSDAGILSILTFSWIGPLLSTGRKRSLDLKDVPQVDVSDTVSGFFPRFQRRIEAYSSSVSAGASSGANNGITSFQLAKALVLSEWKPVAFTAVLEFISTVASFVGPYLINYFVQYLSSDRRFAGEGYLLVFAFTASKMVVGLCNRQYRFILTRVGIRLTGSLVTMIYQKGLKLSSSSRQRHTSGEIANYISVDAETVGYASQHIHDLWQIPVQIALAMLVLYSSLGLAALIALSASFFIMLANIPLSKLLEGFYKSLMDAKDSRMKATSEILRNMRVLKLQAWEMKFLSKIFDLRKNEVRYLWKLVYTVTATEFIFFCAPAFTSALTFWACMLMGIPLRSGNVLTALATLDSLQQPIYFLPFVFQNFVQTKVSLDRISSFLRLEELQPDVVQKLPRGSSAVAIQVSNGSFSWNTSAEALTIRELNFQVLHGMKVAVCGTTGSGKSSLLSCLLGEIPKLSGSVQMCGRVAYVPQSAWILSGTVQENILFGNEMDTVKYDRVLEACSLKKDLESMSFGDQTIIGERGINLSGGQKQRIQIARAIYHDFDIYLFDDPFSAVDAHTGSHLYKECLLKVLESKTVVYVTHQVEFLPSADLIMVIKDGRVAQAGKYNDILNSETNFMELVKAHGDALASCKLKACTSETKTTSLDPQGEQNNAQNDSPHEHGKNEQLVQEEEREKGKVELKVYWKYITMAYQGSLVPLILLSHVLVQLCQIGSNYWMALAAPMSESSGQHVSGMMLISVYVALTVGSALCNLVGSLLLQIAGFKTATLLFQKMHTCLFRAPMSFFDSTPNGRIINRVSSDQIKVDLSIPRQTDYLAFSFIQLLGAIAAMSQASWEVLIMFFPVIAACIWYQQFYLATSRELSRLTGVTEAPIVHHFTESLSGSVPIRCFGQESRFLDTNCKLVNDLSRITFHSSATSQWLSFRIDTLSYLTFAFTLLCLVLSPDGLINPGIAGISVIYGLGLNGAQSSLIWNLCSLENVMISVERILQYTNIPSEGPLTNEINSVDSRWPSRGEINILNLQIRYRPNMPIVLKGLTFNFPGGKKVGIVGRTGSGKSTLIQAMFRIMDPAVGQIIIDGVDISSIGLHDLRSRLSIIPQEPTMFKGTLRSNLDPLEEYTDEQIWKALDCCQLGEVRNKDLKLDSEVAENGENWSVGQRQLVCLARVILKRSKILILDEATASVDTATDNVIQRTLRQEFYQSTVVTVAHRITSVLGSDVVLVLDDGMIAECGEPSKLLEDKSSMFAKLVSEYTIRSGSSFLERNSEQGAQK